MRTAIKDAEKLKAKFDNIMGEKSAFKKDGDGGFALVANGQRYNEEDSDSPKYFKSKEYEIKLTGFLEYKLSYGPTKFLPNALKEFVTIEIYIKPSLDVELIRNAKYYQINGIGAELLNKKDSYDKFQLVGGLALGATAKVKAGKILNFELDANGKAEIEGSASWNRKPVRFVATAKPLVFSFSANVSVGDISLLQYNYIRNLTNEILIYDSDNDK